MSMRFCPECNNLLQPREERLIDRSQNPSLAASYSEYIARGGAPTTRRLIFACRRCRHTELAAEPCIYRNRISHGSDEKTLIIQDVQADPTLPRTQRRCPKCEHPEAIFLQSQNWSQDAGVMLVFVCTKCGWRWTDSDTDIQS